MFLNLGTPRNGTMFRYVYYDPPVAVGWWDGLVSGLPLIGESLGVVVAIGDSSIAAADGMFWSKAQDSPFSQDLLFTF